MQTFAAKNDSVTNRTQEQLTCKNVFYENAKVDII